MSFNIIVEGRIGTTYHPIELESEISKEDLIKLLPLIEELKKENTNQNWTGNLECVYHQIDEDAIKLFKTFLPVYMDYTIHTISSVIIK